MQPYWSGTDQAGPELLKICLSLLELEVCATTLRPTHVALNLASTYKGKHGVYLSEFGLFLLNWVISGFCFCFKVLLCTQAS